MYCKVIKDSVRGEEKPAEKVPLEQILQGCGDWWERVQTERGSFLRPDV